MDAQTIHILNQLTTNFYARCADSFSATRERPWDGWERLLDVLAPTLARPCASVLDIGCGNLRFEEFLSERSSANLSFWCVDNCPQLLPSSANVRFQELDIVSNLEEDTLVESLDAPACDIVCSFGLFHHVPSEALRLRLLDAMLDKASPGGLVIVSLWQFEKDARLFEKARATTRKALEDYPLLHLEEHDWLLGWQHDDRALRYCHSFSDEELEGLVEHAETRARLVDSLLADGKSGELNRYLVLEKST